MEARQSDSDIGGLLRDRSREQFVLLLLGGVAGVATPLLMWTAFLLGALFQPGYDVWRDPTSKLGQLGSGGGTLFNVAFFIVPGLLTVCLAAALATLRGRPWPRLAVSLMIGLSGLSLVASGLIPMSPSSGQLTFWHRFAGLPLLTLLPGGILLLSLALPPEPGWRPYRWLCRVAGSMLVVLIASYELASVPISDGLFQRASLLVLTPWFVAIGLHMLRRRRARGPRRESPGIGYRRHRDQWPFSEPGVEARLSGSGRFQAT